MKNLTLKSLSVLFCISSSVYANTDTDIKKQLSQEGFEFVKQIPAPAGMVGWAGHNNQNPSTVFISNDQQYYIVGDLYNAKGENLSIDAMNHYVKDAVLDDVWKTLEKATWIQDGQVDAPRIVYVFSDPNCPYCQTFWQQARPWVESGKVQLRHIQVGVIRDESRAQVATLLMSKNPQALFKEIHTQKTASALKPATDIPADIAKKIDFNEGLMDKYGFFSTPAIIWKDSHAQFQSAQGLPTDLKAVFEQ